MAVIDPNSLPRPIVTGTPALQPQTTGKTPGTAQGTQSFLGVLQQQLEQDSNTAFSKHAVSRVMERQIDVSRPNMERLNAGMQLAQEKGLRDALILIDQSAYIVNVAAGKVITVDGEAQKGSVFTNIDGTVIA
ncbi:flagellar protein [Ruminococcaceae bacterium OttesenSCG-928-O06]|nr:flagellar protein [Ruminococcaceae bacterium OttesenSCG-928-O06]